MKAQSARGLAPRLFAAQTLVAIAGAATVWIVAAALGPTIFHGHLSQAHVQTSGEAARHVEDAFQSASNISIATALLASVVAALAVSWFVTRRNADPVRRLPALPRPSPQARPTSACLHPGSAMNSTISPALSTKWRRDLSRWRRRDGGCLPTLPTRCGRRWRRSRPTSPG